LFCCFIMFYIALPSRVNWSKRTSEFRFGRPESQEYVQATLCHVPINTWGK